MAGNNPFSAAWSRGGNLLCHGHWIISWQNQALQLPESRREKDMGTWAIYSIIDPEDDTFAQGLKEDEWIIENVDWLTDVFLTPVFRWRRLTIGIFTRRSIRRTGGVQAVRGVCKSVRGE